MMLRVEQGKGQRDRDVMLSPQLLQLLHEWWKAARPQVWLFAVNTVRHIKSPLDRLDIKLTKRTPPA